MKRHKWLLKYILQRAAFAFSVVWVMATLIFGVSHLMPRDTVEKQIMLLLPISGPSRKELEERIAYFDCYTYGACDVE